ncbi:MAG TPA: ATP-binding cassette domain-containing protein [Kineosporiaceae bacterium]|nr:ATP-binding cassette domain-containing protein [Kineosporiaceae bacterium]
MSDLVIATRGLTKVFRRQAAVDGIDLAVPRGAVYGFLGPNGSGKTTTIRVLLGLAAATAGQIEVLGRPMPRDLRVVLPRVGALVEGPAFYPFLSGADNLRRLDSADRDAPRRTRDARVAAALDRVGLTNAAGKRVRAYSLGMKQRLGIAAALLGPRELLVLDEPTNGLDPQGTREVRHLVRSLAADGTTVFVSSHLLAEVEQICTHVGVMSAGRLVAQGPLDEFGSSGPPLVQVRTPDTARAAQVLRRLGLDTVSIRDGSVHGRLTAPAEALPGNGSRPDAQPDRPPDEQPDGRVEPEDVVAALVTEGVRVRGFAVERESLEDRFVALTGEGFEVVR